MKHIVKTNQKIQDVINQANDGDVIYIEPGTYKEKLNIATNNLHIIGMGTGEVKITYNDFALKDHKDGKRFGTFRSYTCLVEGDNIVLENLSIENSSGDGRQVGQAIALYVDAHFVQVKNCRLLGCQDTVFLAPLPKRPRIEGSFIGPSEHKAYRHLESYFDHCYIEGDVDFIFGGGQAFFHGCQLLSKNRHETINGYVSAPSTDASQPYGFVFYGCDFLAEEGIRPGSVFLGRPWRKFAQVMLIGCSIAQHIHSEGWDDWNNCDNRKTTQFSEYKCKYANSTVTKYRRGNAPFIRIEDHEPSLNFLSDWHKKCFEVEDG